jgi:hypothetical protein
MPLKRLFKRFRREKRMTPKEKERKKRLELINKMPRELKLKYFDIRDLLSKEKQEDWEDINFEREDHPLNIFNELTKYLDFNLLINIDDKGNIIPGPKEHLEDYEREVIEWYNKVHLRKLARASWDKELKRWKEELLSLSREKKTRK